MEMRVVVVLYWSSYAFNLFHSWTMVRHHPYCCCCYCCGGQLQQFLLRAQKQLMPVQPLVAVVTAVASYPFLGYVVASQTTRDSIFFFYCCCYCCLFRMADLVADLHYLHHQ
jgi:hypothetical protein